MNGSVNGARFLLASVGLAFLASVASAQSRTPDSHWPRWSPGQTSSISEGLQQPDPAGIFHGLAVSADGMTLLHITSRFPRRGFTGESNFPDAEPVWTSPGTGAGYGTIAGGQCIVADNGDIHAYFTAQVIVTDLNGASVPWLRLFYVSKPWWGAWTAPIAASGVLAASTASQESVREIAVSQDGTVVTCWYEQEEATYALSGGTWTATKRVTKLWKHTVGGAAEIDAAGIENDPAMSAPSLAAHRGRVARLVSPYGETGMRLYYYDGSSATLVRSHTLGLGLGPAGLYVALDSTPRLTWLEDDGSAVNVRHVAGTSGALGETWGPGSGGAVYPDANGVLHRFWLGPAGSGELRHSIRSGSAWTTPAVSASPCAGLRTLGLDSPGRWFVVDAAPGGTGTLTWSWEDNLGMQDAPTMLPTGVGAWINLGNGNVFWPVGLFQTKAECESPEWTLYYNSLDRNEGICGQGWRHSYSISLHACSAGLLLTLPEGQRVVCEYSADAGGYVPRPEYGISLKITEIIGDPIIKWRLETAGGVFWNFDALGKPRTKVDRDGHAMTFSYSGDAKKNLIQVSGGCKTVDITYDAKDRILEIIDPEATRYELIYDDAQDTLIEIHFKDKDGVVLRVWTATYFPVSGAVVPLPAGVVLPAGGTEFAGVKGLLSSIKTPVMNEETPDPKQNFLFAYRATGEFVGRAYLFYDPEMMYAGVPSRKHLAVTYYSAVEMLGLVPGFTTTFTDREDNVFELLIDYSRNLALRIIDPVNGPAHPTLRTFDGRRNLLSITDPAERTTTYTMVGPADGMASWVQDLVRSVRLPGDTDETTIEYHPTLNVPTRVIPVTGTADAVTYGYNAQGHMVTMQLPGDPGPYTWTYDASGRNLTSVDPGGSNDNYTYGPCPCDQVQTITHSGVLTETGQLASSNITYTPMGSISTNDCPRGGIFQNIYSPLHQVVQQKAPPNANPAVTDIVRNADGAITQITNPNGLVTKLTVNHLGQVTSIENPEHSVMTLEYTPNGLLSKVLNFNGQEILATSNALGQTISASVQIDETSSLFLDWQGTWDGSGNLTSETVSGTGNNPSPRTTTYTFGPRNLLDKVALPGDTTEIWFHYGLRGELLAAETRWKAPGTSDFAFLQGTGKVYDSQLRAMKFVVMNAPLPPSGIPTGRETVCTYSPAGLVSSVTTPMGFTTTIQHDIANRVSQTIDPTGVSVKSVYDDSSRLIENRINIPGFGEQAPMTSHYNCRGEMVWTHDNVNPTEFTNRVYDAGGRLCEVSGPLGGLAQFEYTDLNAVKATLIQKAAGQMLRYEAQYDTVSNVAKTIAPPGEAGGGPAWTYLHNRGSQTTSVASPIAGHVRTLQHDALGNLTFAQDEDGNQTVHTFNALNQLIESTYTKADSSLWEHITRTYDGAGNVLSIEGEVSGIRVEYTYQPLSGPDPHTLDLYAVTWKLGGSVWKRVEYDRDDDGRVTETRVRDAQGQVTHVQDTTFDQTGRPLEIRNAGVPIAQFEYEDGFLARTVFPQTGSSIRRFYTKGGDIERLVHLDAAGHVLASIEYTLDARHRRTGVYYGHLDLQSTFAYNDASWLTSESHAAPAGGPTWTNTEVTRAGGNTAAPTQAPAVTPTGTPANVNFQAANTYDDRGNRVARLGTGIQQQCQMDAEDRLVFEMRNGVPIQYQYSNRGDLVQKIEGATITHYGSNHAGQMTHYSGPGQDWNYVYGPEGTRLAKIDTLSLQQREEWYLPDGADTLVDYLRTNGQEQADGVYVSGGLDNNVARINAQGQANYFFADALGSIHQTMNATGAVTGTNFTDAWGNKLNLGLQPPTGMGARFGFTGRENDDESGLMHYRARTYDPMIGRFLSRDPVRHSNLYFYGANSPTGAVDPFGTDIVLDAGSASALEKLLGAENLSTPASVNGDVALHLADYMSDAEAMKRILQWLKNMRMERAELAAGVLRAMRSKDLISMIEVIRALPDPRSHGGPRIEVDPNPIPDCAIGAPKRDLTEAEARREYELEQAWNAERARIRDETPNDRVMKFVALSFFGEFAALLARGAGATEALAQASARAQAGAAATRAVKFVGEAEGWALRDAAITARLREHLALAVRRANLTKAQYADILKSGRSSMHWGTQIDTEFKLLVQNDPLLKGEVAVSERGVSAPDVVDLRSKRWWDVTTTPEEFGKKGVKYDVQYGEGTALLYAK